MIEEKLESLGIKLPDPPTPAGSYVPAVRTGNLLYISGQIPMEDGKVIFTGKVSDNNLEIAQKSARMCAINILAQIKREVGDLDKVSKIVRLSGFVNSVSEFSQQHKLSIQLQICFLRFLVRKENILELRLEYLVYH